jgi:hypothetical protein
MAESVTRTVGMVGLYDSPDALFKAAEHVRDAGYRKWDCHTPYPVHGLDEAMGLRESAIPYLTVLAGFVGVGVALLMTGGLSAWQYPIHIGGKALFSWQAFVAICFELFVLLAAVTTMISMVVFCRLGRWHSPLHDSGLMREVITERFAIVLDAADEKYTEDGARALLLATGCRDIRPLIEQEDDGALI